MQNTDLLNPMQQEAVEYTEGPLLILAGAGSGKTRVLTHRIAYLIEECGINPYSILAITFTNKAAKEMRSRVDRLVSVGASDVFVSTFHSMCARFLRRDIDRIGYDKSFTIYDTDDQKSLMKAVLKALDIDTKRIRERVFINAISDAKNELISPALFDEQAGGDYMRQKIARVYYEYQKRLKDNNALDFDDLLMKTVELFREAPDVLQKYQRRFRYIMVDEYQDTNRAQFELLKLLAERNGENGTEHNLCVVGDDDQSIYSFRGADIRNILDFEYVFPDTKVIKLEQNYRSTQTILDVANAVIENNFERKEKNMWTENPKGGPVRLHIYDSDRSEARGIIDEIKGLYRQGASLSDFAILYRTNAQSRLFEEQLVYSSMPYKLVGGVNFYSRMEVKDILSYLKTIENGVDSLALKRIINVPKRGIGNTTLEKLESYAFENGIPLFEALAKADQVPGISAGTRTKISVFVSMIEDMRQSAAEGLNVSGLISLICEKTDYLEYLDEYCDSDDEIVERRSNISELISKAAVFEEELYSEASETLPLSAFLQEVSLVADIDDVNDDVSGVTLMTLHSAKGLEFRNVYIVGLEEELFPGAGVLMSEDPDVEVEEERRLMYVGITRAMNSLSLSYAKQRMTRGEIKYGNRSRFIKEIPAHLLEITTDSPSHSYISDTVRKPAKQTDGYRSPDFDESAGFSTFQKKPAATAPAKSFGTKDPTVLEYAPGDTVFHSKFGEGVVTDIVAGGKDFEVSVDFGKSYGVRKMLASFAHLKKV